MSSMHKGAAGGLVYSTDGGRMCPLCRQAVSACACRATAQVPAATVWCASAARPMAAAARQ
jgi:translation initiation factor 1